MHQLYNSVLVSKSVTLFIFPLCFFRKLVKIFTHCGMWSMKSVIKQPDSACRYYHTHSTSENHLLRQYTQVTFLGLTFLLWLQSLCHHNQTTFKEFCLALLSDSFSQMLNVLGILEYTVKPVLKMVPLVIVVVVSSLTLYPGDPGLFPRSGIHDLLKYRGQLESGEL